MTWFRKRIIFLAALCIYSVSFLILILYWMYTESRNSSSEHEALPINEKLPEELAHPSKIIPVEIWGKASISLYLWTHILKGPLQSIHNGFMKVGNLTINSFKFSFKNGAAFIQTTVPSDVEYLVLILNGRTDEKVTSCRAWLNYLKNFKRLKKVCVVLLGSERCENDWILPYMASRGGPVNAAFIVYDSPLVDDHETFQWPLGVAEYRGFPDFEESSVDLVNKRPYIANFVGTVYKNSSREKLVEVIKSNHWTDTIQLIVRNEWMAQETDETRSQYLQSLQASDLTLSPVGMNAECYRLYEALALGSVPVVEVRRSGVAGGKCESPLRLLRQLDAPLVALPSWRDGLPRLLRSERTLSLAQVTARRLAAFRWYRNFKRKMRDKFLQVLANKFLDDRSSFELFSCTAHVGLELDIFSGIYVGG